MLNKLTGTYEGKGNGTTWTSFENYVGLGTLFANVTNGVISMDGASDLREPMLLQDMTNASKGGKIHLDPGWIKTSVLHDRFSIGLNSLFNKYPFVEPGTSTRYKVGKFRIMALEKMIETNAASTPNIAVGYEHNIRVAVGISGGYWKTQTSFIQL